MQKKAPTRAGIIAAVTAILLFAAVVAAGVELSTYRIRPDLSDLETCVAEYSSRGRETAPSPPVKIYDSVTFGKQTVVLLEIGEDLGTAILQKNLLGYFKIDRLGYGSGSFRYGVIRHGGRACMLLGGRNTAGEIAGAEFLQGGTRYHLDIPQKPRFLVCTEVDASTDELYWDLNTLTLFDSQGRDITERCDLSGGGI